jgi:Flp pilus assembly protein TadB
LYYFEVFPTDKLIHKALITFAIIAVMLPCIWVWAFKRKKRFSRELLELNDLLEGGKV